MSVAGGPGALVEFARGAPDLVETRHTGAVAVVSGTGELLWRAGDPSRPFPLRSTAKAFQLLPLLLDGLHEEARLEPADLAVMMSSHSGEPMHVERIAELLRRFDLDAEQLLCGTHPPSSSTAREALVRAGLVPGPLHNNCSGKHTGMLAVCARRGWPLASYLERDHPLQRRIHAILATLSGEDGTALPVSVDGCSLPTLWMPLTSLARLFSRMALPSEAPRVEDRDIEPELMRLREAAMAHPELIAGTRRLDTELMRALPGRVFTKTGASGMYALALTPSREHPRGLGIALKVDDGDPDSRVRAVAVVEVLRQLGLEQGEDAAVVERLEAVARRKHHNFGGIEVGEYRPVFELEPTG